MASLLVGKSGARRQVEPTIRQHQEEVVCACFYRNTLKHAEKFGTCRGCRSPLPGFKVKKVVLQ